MIQSNHKSISNRQQLRGVDTPEHVMATAPETEFHLRLKWGLALLGEEKAKEYLGWLRKRLNNSR